MSRPISRVLSSARAKWRSFICDTRHHVPVATYPKIYADHVLLHSNISPYLVLLQVGFTLPPALAGAVRSYRTISPLPNLPTQLRTTARSIRRYIFCGTFRRLAPPRRYLAPCPMEPGLSSAAKTAYGDCLVSSPTRKSGTTPKLSQAVMPIFLTYICRERASALRSASSWCAG